MTARFSRVRLSSAEDFQKTLTAFEQRLGMEEICIDYSSKCRWPRGLRDVPAAEHLEAWRGGGESVLL
jgi:hypothetical protein